MSMRAYSASDSDVSETDNTYCIFLHIVEGIGMIPKDGTGDYSGDRLRGKIILNASLNGIKFEVEGHCTETATIFNSNCIWECELGDVKRMKTDNRPVKLECFLKPGSLDHMPRILIGSVLLPMRSLQTIASTRNLHLKLHWHKLGAISSEWRHLKPEIYLLLVIVKKCLVESGELEVLLGQKKNMSSDLLSPQVSETTLMLQSKSNIYVQLLEQVGLIQVGNNPSVDCDIFNVSLTFKQLKNVGTEQLLGHERNFNNVQQQVIDFNYDFLGSTSHLEIFVNSSDCYSINEKISLSFKSSLKSLREYFQRIFYIPINLYLNGVAIANYQFDFSKILPDDGYFNSQTLWTKIGSFHFDRLHKKLSPRAAKPMVDFIFNIQLLQCYSKRSTYSKFTFSNESFTAYERDNRAGGDLTDVYRNAEFTQIQNENRPLSSRNLWNYDPFKRNYVRSNSEPLLVLEEAVKDVCLSDREPSNMKQVEPLNKDAPTAAAVCTKKEDLKISENIEKRTASTETQTDHQEISEPKINIEEATLNIVQELEEWKEQQMEHFMHELERKEFAYLADLREEWDHEHLKLKKKLERKIADCEEMNSQLERAHHELVADASQRKANTQIAETIKNDIQRSYSDKFAALELELKRLQTERSAKGDILEKQQRELELQNSKLEKERSDLKGRITELETNLLAVEKTHLSAQEFKEVLNDLRVQTERFVTMEQSKNYYKEQWAKATRELHKVKLNVLQQQEPCIRETESNNLNACIEEILTGEQDALQTDRNDLKSIKEVLYDASDWSSNCDFDVD